MVSSGEKAKMKKAGNLNLGRSYVITTVLILYSIFEKVRTQNLDKNAKERNSYCAIHFWGLKGIGSIPIPLQINNRSRNTSTNTSRVFYSHSSQCLHLDSAQRCLLKISCPITIYCQSYEYETWLLILECVKFLAENHACRQLHGRKKCYILLEHFIKMYNTTSSKYNKSYQVM